MSNSANRMSNTLEEMEPLEGISAGRNVQFGDVGLEDYDDSQDDNMDHDADPITAILDRQAKAIEKLASGVKDIAQALREIAVALAPQHLQRVMPAQSIESPIE